MSKKFRTYFNLPWIVSLILVIIPVTAWWCGVIQAFVRGHIIRGILRIFLGGWILWVLDLIFFIFTKELFLEK
jgi:threonine/homoserine/homoserine lactone efflux protein